MARTLLTMANSLDKRAAAVGAFGNELKKRKVMAAVRYLAYHTPVDTSKTLSNWEVTLDYPTARPTGAFYKGKGGSTQAISAEATINFAAAVLENVKPGQAVWISNAQPHIIRLNDGGGRFMPGGFIEGARLIIRITQ